MSNIVLRKVRNGRVKIGGMWFYPVDNDRPYTGELEGKWCLFGRYMIANRYEPYVCLWGTKRLLEALKTDDTTYSMSQEPHCIDRIFFWEWWHADRDTIQQMYDAETDEWFKFHYGRNLEVWTA